MIKYDDFAKLDIQVAEVKKAEPVDGSEKLLRLEIDLGNERKQIIAGIAKEYKPGELIGKQIIVLANLEPKKLMGLESDGMLLAADPRFTEGSGEASDENGPVLLIPEKSVKLGSKIK